jgi:hypothetical protein
LFEPLDSAQCHLLLMLAPPVSRPNDASWHRPPFAFIAGAAATTAAAVTATGAVSAAAVADYGECPSVFLVYDVSLFLLVSCFCFSHYCCCFDFYRNGCIQAHSLSNAYIDLVCRFTYRYRFYSNSILYYCCYYHYRIIKAFFLFKDMDAKSSIGCSWPSFKKCVNNETVTYKVELNMWYITVYTKMLPEFSQTILCLSGNYC